MRAARGRGEQPRAKPWGLGASCLTPTARRAVPARCQALCWMQGRRGEQAWSSGDPGQAQCGRGRGHVGGTHGAGLGAVRMCPLARHRSTTGAAWEGRRAGLGGLGEGLREAEGCVVEGWGGVVGQPWL